MKKRIEDFLEHPLGFLVSGYLGVAVVVGAGYMAIENYQPSAEPPLTVFEEEDDDSPENSYLSQPKKGDQLFFEYELEFEDGAESEIETPTPFVLSAGPSGERYLLHPNPPGADDGLILLILEENVRIDRGESTRFKTKLEFYRHLDTDGDYTISQEERETYGKSLGK